MCEFFNAGRGGTALLEELELTLPAGEFAYLEKFLTFPEVLGQKSWNLNLFLLGFCTN